MIYDPATDTFSVNYGHPPPPPPPEGPLQREWDALGTTILVVLLAPFWLAIKGCEKFHEWQQDRTYAFQEEVMKQPPIAVMVCKLAAPIPGELSKLRVVSRQPSQEPRDEKWDLMVLAPSKGEKDAQWITCQVKSGESLNESNFSCFNNGLLSLRGT